MKADIEKAKAEAERARKRLASTLGMLQHRLKPASVANEAWTGIRDKSSEIADDAVEAVKAKPAVASAAVAAFALFLARGQIASAASRMFARYKGRKSRAPKDKAALHGVAAE